MKKVRKSPGTIEGEGSYSAARAYDAAARQDAKRGHSAEAAANASKALDGPEGESLRAAERAAKEGPARRAAKT